jgi:hypothetical protein
MQCGCSHFGAAVRIPGDAKNLFHDFGASLNTYLQFRRAVIGAMFRFDLAGSVIFRAAAGRDEDVVSKV